MLMYSAHAHSEIIPIVKFTAQVSKYKTVAIFTNSHIPIMKITKMDFSMLIRAIYYSY